MAQGGGGSTMTGSKPPQMVVVVAAAGDGRDGATGPLPQYDSAPATANQHLLVPLLGDEKDGSVNGVGRARKQPCKSSSSSSSSSSGVSLISPQAGVTMNLMSCFVGGGIVSLPYAFQKASILPSILLTLLCAAATIVSVQILAKLAEKLPARSYAEIGNVWTGREDIAKTFVDGVNALVLGGVILSLEILVKDNFELLIPASSSLSSGVATGLVVLLVVFPLSLARELSFLRFSSLGVVLALTFLVAVVVTRGAGERGHADDDYDGESEWAWCSTTFGDVLDVLPIFIFVFGCQQQVIPLYWSLQGQLPESSAHRGADKFAGVGVGAICSYTFYACVMGFFGVMAFPDGAINEDILKAFPAGSKLAIAGRISMTAALALMCPLLVYPTRASLLALVFGLDAAAAEHGGSKAQLGAVTATILGATFAVAVQLPGVAIVYRLVGSVGGAFLFFIYPAACFLRRGRERGFWRRAAWVILALGFFVMITGTTAAISDMV